MFKGKMKMLLRDHKDGFLLIFDYFSLLKRQTALWLFGYLLSIKQGRF